MTNRQKSIITAELQKAGSPFYETVKAKFRYDIEENILKLYFAEQKPQYRVCQILKISKRVFYYHLNALLDFSFLIAKEAEII